MLAALMRRRLALAAAAALAAPAASAQPRGVRPEQRLRCGAELALMASGLARALQGAFGRDTGLAVQLLAAPATALLAAVREGEVDVALCNAPDAEAALEREGLAHARRPVAIGGFWLVGPAGGRTPAAAVGNASGGVGATRRSAGSGATGGSGAPGATRGIGAPRDAVPAGALGAAPAGAAAAFASLARGGATAEAPFLSPDDGSGTHLAELRLWRAAGVEPRPPWHRPAAADRDWLAQVREGGAWALVERGAWQAGGSGRARVVLRDDPALEVPVHALRSFRSPNPAGRLWSDWVGGARGRAVAAARPGYRRA